MLSYDSLIVLTKGSTISLYILHVNISIDDNFLLIFLYAYCLYFSSFSLYSIECKKIFWIEKLKNI